MICESVVSSPTLVASQRINPDWFSVPAETIEVEGIEVDTETGEITEVDHA